MDSFNDGDKVYDSGHLAWQFGTVKNKPNGQIQVEYPKHGFKLYGDGRTLSQENAANLQKAWYHKTYPKWGPGYYKQNRGEKYVFPDVDREIIPNEKTKADFTHDPPEDVGTAETTPPGLRF